MILNYYIHTRDIEMVFDLGKRVIPLYNDRVFECHLCQTSGRLKPMFEEHSYKNFEELKFILRNKKYQFDIVNEYGEIIDVEFFIEDMERKNRIGETRFGVPMDIFGYHFLDKDFC